MQLSREDLSVKYIFMMPLNELYSHGCRSRRKRLSVVRTRRISAAGHRISRSAGTFMLASRLLRPAVNNQLSLNIENRLKRAHSQNWRIRWDSCTFSTASAACSTVRSRYVCLHTAERTWAEWCCCLLLLCPKVKNFSGRNRAELSVLQVSWYFVASTLICRIINTMQHVSNCSVWKTKAD